METQRHRRLDRINTLPENIIEHILTLMPIQDALRTSVLSKKWRYSWRSMPKLVFTDDMVKVTSSRHGWKELKKYKLVNAIFHVLLFHNGPTILEFDCSVGELQMVSECDQIIGYISRGNTVKELKFVSCDLYYKLPITFFSWQGLEDIHLTKCKFQPPLTFNGFSRLRSIVLDDVEVSAKILQAIFSNSPLLEEVFLDEDFGYLKVLYEVLVC
ncbi:hypothetical protein QVD17_20919 [Tagetes erecta]|uniref:F-box domain-containing protein n=1 Tax=Tagetes erecta TaxID=13708 RepID=A0AAD8NRF4_TARER|nr:hypothetical protein QVD17_20919 [Tagetes erecta]